MRIMMLLTLAFIHLMVLYGESKGEIYVKNLENLSIHTKQGTYNLSEVIKGRPAIITFIYTRCSSGCYPFVLHLKDELGDEEDVAVIVLSFDKKDTVEDMHAVSKNFDLDNRKNWMFGVLKEEDLNKLLSELRFNYSWNSQRGEYEHPLLILGVDRKGNVTWEIENPKKLYLLKAFIGELKGKNFVPTYALEQTFLTCFTYNPDKGNWELSYGMLLIALPAILALFTAISLHFILATGRKNLD